MISVYDVEILKNVFCCTFKNIRSGEVRSFVVSPWQNQWAEFVDYYLSHTGLIGFNCIDFDEKLLHPFITDRLISKDMEMGDSWEKNPASLIKEMGRRANQLIKEDFQEDWAAPHVPQRDLYRIYHFNNKARMTSLKYLQINMGWHNVQEMPFDHRSVLKEHEIAELLAYNLNDVESTHEFYLRSRDKIKLRNALSEKYRIDMGNFNDGKIGEAIFISEIAKRTGRSEKSLRNLKTPRKNIVIRECLVDGIEFTSPEFRRIHENYKKMSISSTRKAESSFAVFDGVKYEFGLGGLHACRGAGVYTNVRSADVVSYYPNLAIKYRLYPLHLGPVFCEVYDTIFQLRGTYKKGTPENMALKYTLNIPFGQSMAPWSPFYDPMYGMSITVNGQLLLAMLCEQITVQGAGRVLMANTDGIEVDVKDDNLFKIICDQWQARTKLTLESTTYSKLCIRDVNNYIGFTTKGDMKSKGDFEVEKEEIHKDRSMKIVRQAVLEYFRDGRPVESTIGSSTSIADFVLGKRAKTGNLEYRDASTGELARVKLPKNVRYYISRSGGSIVKVLKAVEKGVGKVVVTPNQINLFEADIKEKVEDKERIVNAHVGYRQTLFNKWVDKPFNEYNIETQFYVREANKLINSVVQNQTTI